MTMVMPVMPKSKKQQLISQGYEDATGQPQQPVIVSALGGIGKAEQLSSIPLSWGEARLMSDYLWQSGRAPMLVKVAGGWTVYALPVSIPISVTTTTLQPASSVKTETQELQQAS